MPEDFYKAKTTHECFKVLGIEPTNDLKEIKKAYRELAKRYHPDVNPDEKTKFLEVHWAYEMLTNPDFKHKYLKDITNLNVNIYFTVTFEEGFFGKELILNINPTLNKVQKEGNESDIFIERFSFKLKPGTQGTHTFSFKGKGLKRGEDVGDFFINVSVTPHKNYTVKGEDVYSIINVPLMKMLKGGKEEVMTMYGIKKLKIPPGTKPGDLLPVKKCGVERKGKHFFEVKPVFPEKQEMQSNNDWFGLNIDWTEKAEEDQELDEFEKLFEKYTNDK